MPIFLEDKKEGQNIPEISLLLLTYVWITHSSPYHSSKVLETYAAAAHVIDDQNG